MSVGQRTVTVESAVQQMITAVNAFLSGATGVAAGSNNRFEERLTDLENQSQVLIANLEAHIGVNCQHSGSRVHAYTRELGGKLAKLEQRFKSVAFSTLTRTCRRATATPESLVKS